jgi:hypothetical protein
VLGVTQQRPGRSLARIIRQARDNEIEFDYVIPVSEGRSSEEHNICLTCFKYN